MNNENPRMNKFLGLEEKKPFCNAFTEYVSTSPIEFATKKHYYMTYYMELLCNNFHYRSVKSITDWVLKHYRLSIFPEILFEECLLVPCGSAVANFLFPITNKHS